MVDNFRKSPSDEYQFSFDPFHHALTVINEEHRLIHQGMVFAINAAELDIADGAVRQGLYRVQGTPVHLKRFSISASEGPVIMTVYESPNYDDVGSPQANPTINLNRMSSKTSTMLVTGAPLLLGNPLAGADRGDPVLGSLYIPQNGNTGVTGETGAIEELLLASNTDYLIEFQNDPAGSGTADVFATIVWYELSYDLS